MNVGTLILRAGITNRNIGVWILVLILIFAIYIAISES
jgi:hypothetical protein